MSTQAFSLLTMPSKSTVKQLYQVFLFLSILSLKHMDIPFVSVITRDGLDSNPVSDSDQLDSDSGSR